MCNSELRECRYCKHYADSVCTRLSVDLVNVLEVLVDSYLCNTDFKEVAEEHSCNSSINDEIVYTFGCIEELIPRLSKKKGEQIYNLLKTRFGSVSDKYLDGLVEPAEDILCGLLPYLKRHIDEFSDCLGVSVESDFYCKYWE